MKLFKSNHNYFRSQNCNSVIDTPCGKIAFELKVNDYDFSNTNSKADCLRLSNGGTLLSYNHDKFIAELVICEPTYSIPKHMNVEKVVAGVWRVKPLVNNLKCIFETKLEPFNSKDLVRGSSSGEGVDAIEFNYKEYRMTIGTEDGLTLINRSIEKDMMENRFSPLNYEFPDNIIEYINDYMGLSVPLTSLEVNETSQIHFVVAWNKFVNEHDNSTWFSVDMQGDVILSKEGLI